MGAGGDGTTTNWHAGASGRSTGNDAGAGGHGSAINIPPETTAIESGGGGGLGIVRVLGALTGSQISPTPTLH